MSCIGHRFSYRQRETLAQMNVPFAQRFKCDKLRSYYGLLIQNTQVTLGVLLLQGNRQGTDSPRSVVKLLTPGSGRQVSPDNQQLTGNDRISDQNQE